MVHSVSGWTRGVQVKLWDPLRTHAIPERLVHDEALYKFTFTFTFTIRSAVGENPMLHAHFIALCVIDVKILATEFWHCTEVDLSWNAYISYVCSCCGSFVDPVTLTLTRWPSYTNLMHIAWRYIVCANMNFLDEVFRKLLSDRQTYRIDRNYRLLNIHTYGCHSHFVFLAWHDGTRQWSCDQEVSR